MTEPQLTSSVLTDFRIFIVTAFARRTIRE
jgi:hypothetical protein